MKLPKAVQLALQLLEEAGYEAVVVGGAVRDYLLGKEASDYDISTNARPEEVKEVFKDYHTLDIGIKHGTVTVFIKGRRIEITTYRSEKDYEDFRHPKEVVFEKSLEADLERRDFTVNAICYNRGLIDKVGGIADLEAGLIRAIGDPVLRFKEDPLRILRALRFAATLDFRIEAGTKAGIFREKELLRKVSNERINLEFSKLLLGSSAPSVLSEYEAVIRVFLPELPADYRNLFFAFREFSELTSRIAALLWGMDPLQAEAALKRLKYSKREVGRVVFLLENKDLTIKADEIEIGKLLKDTELGDLRKLVEMQKAFSVSQAETDRLERILSILYNLDPNKCLRLKDLAVSGRDLLAMGYPEGAGIRILLDELLDLVIEGKLDNEKEELLGYLEKKHPPQGKMLAKR